MLRLNMRLCLAILCQATPLKRQMKFEGIDETVDLSTSRGMKDYHPTESLKTRLDSYYI